VEWEDADDEMQTIVDGTTARAGNFVPRTSSQERGGGWSQSKDSDAVKKGSTERLSHKASPAGRVAKMIAGELLNHMSQFTDLIDEIHYVHIVCSYCTGVSSWGSDKNDSWGAPKPYVIVHRLLSLTA
jgi:hypothetical protein